MSMSEREIVKLTCEVMERQFPIGTRPDWLDCTRANELVHYWDARRRELEAAEEEGREAIPKPVGEKEYWIGRLIHLEDLVASANVKIEELEKKLKRVPEWDSLDRLVGGLRADIDRGLGSVRADVRAELKHHRHRHGDSGECYSP